MQEVSDQTGRTVSVPDNPQRIISLVPSQTELLFDLGLDEEIVGVTLFCIHPSEKVKSKEKVGGTKKLNLEKIRSLKPDLIIGNKEENEREQILDLAKEFPVWISDIGNFEEAIDMIRQLGDLCRHKQRAEELISTIKSAYTDFPKLADLRTLYLIWRKPYMSVGHDTFIHSQLELCGLQNASGNVGRYPVLEKETIKELAPELILLSSEPYPFQEKHIRELQEIVPSAKILLVDGEMFSWYGSRLLKAADYLRSISKHFHL